MTDFKIRIAALIFAIVLFVSLCFYSSCKRSQEPELIQTEVALAEDGTKITHYVDKQGNRYIKYNDSEVTLIEE